MNIFKRICRACMQKTQNVFPIEGITDHSITISEMLVTTTPQLMIQNDDQLPKLICSACLNKLLIAYNFQKMCIESDKKMGAMLKLHMQAESSETAVECSKTNTGSNIELALMSSTTPDVQTQPKLEIPSYDLIVVEDKSNEEIVLCEELVDELEEIDEHKSNSVCSEMDCSDPSETAIPKKVLRGRPKKCTEIIDSIDVLSSIANDNDRSEILSNTTHPRSHRTRLQVNSTKSLQCNQCTKSFNLKKTYLEHIKQHGKHNKIELKRQKKNLLMAYECEHCDKAFERASTLKEHLRTHTGESPFLCPHCGKLFKKSTNMHQHVLRHSNEKRYQCPQCPSKFSCLSDQIKHMSTHSAIKPHVCDICGSRFTRSYSLAKHKYIHTGERPHKCEECSMTFVFNEHLRRHMRTHTGEKPYKCTYCTRAYAESGDLTKHLRTHVGEKTYICSKCPAAFKYQIELREHDIEHYLSYKDANGVNKTSTTT